MSEVITLFFKENPSKLEKGVSSHLHYNRMEFFISGPVMDQIVSCEKQAGPGEVYISAIAWMLVEKDRMTGVQRGKGALSNFQLESVDFPVDIPGKRNRL